MRLSIRTLAACALCCALSSCEGDDADMPFEDELLEIAIGDDSADAVEAALDARWVQEPSGPQSAPGRSLLLFRDPSGGSRLALTLDSGHVSFVDRLWSFPGSDTLKARALHDSIARVLDRRYPRRDLESIRYWVLGAAPDTSLASVGLTLPSGAGDSCSVELAVVGSAWIRATE